METKFKVGDTVYTYSYNKYMLIKNIRVKGKVSYYYYNIWNNSTWKDSKFPLFDEGSPVGKNCIKVPNELIPILYGIDCE